MNDIPIISAALCSSCNLFPHFIFTLKMNFTRTNIITARIQVMVNLPQRPLLQLKHFTLHMGDKHKQFELLSVALLSVTL